MCSGEAYAAQAAAIADDPFTAVEDGPARCSSASQISNLVVRADPTTLSREVFVNKAVTVTREPAGRAS